MSLDILKRRAKVVESSKPAPDWVSAKNVSLAAYKCINRCKDERLKYISQHNKIMDYKKKGLYQINASEIARSIGAATPTLISTSAYSSGLKRYLDEVNQMLENVKDKKLKTHLKTLSGGLKQRKKDELRLELQSIRVELEALKKSNAIEQAEKVLASLSLPIKQKLGMNV